MNGTAGRLFKAISSNFMTQKYLYTLAKTFTFKSAYSLDKLYPKSTLKLATPEFVPESTDNKFTGYIPIESLDITYSRSSGPGGQSVNTTSSKVDLRFHVQSANWLSEEIRKIMLEAYKTRINKDGYFIIKSQITRSQQLNLAHALEKLRSMIRAIAEPPKEPSPESLEKKRKALLQAARKRVHEKRLYSLKKHSRQSNPFC